MQENEKRIPLKYGTAVVDKNVKPETIEALNAMAELAYNKVSELRTSMVQQTIKSREDQLLGKLKENGFEFENRMELVHFLKTRCLLERYPNQLNVLRVDGRILCEWWETVRYENDGSKFTCIIGEPPASN